MGTGLYHQRPDLLPPGVIQVPPGTAIVDVQNWPALSQGGPDASPTKNQIHTRGYADHPYQAHINKR